MRSNKFLLLFILLIVYSIPIVSAKSGSASGDGLDNSVLIISSLALSIYVFKIEQNRRGLENSTDGIFTLPSRAFNGIILMLIGISDMQLFLFGLVVLSLILLWQGVPLLARFQNWFALTLALSDLIIIILIFSNKFTQASLSLAMLISVFLVHLEHYFVLRRRNTFHNQSEISRPEAISHTENRGYEKEEEFDWGEINWDDDTSPTLPDGWTEEQWEAYGDEYLDFIAREENKNENQYEEEILPTDDHELAIMLARKLIAEGYPVDIAFAYAEKLYGI